MEIRIGILHAPREVMIDTVSSADELQSAIDAALAKGTTLRLVDDKGRVVLVPAANIAFIEIAGSEGRRVGF